MFSNNKLYGHQPSIKLEIGEPLPNRRQDIILSRVRIGHTYLTHAYLLKGKTAPQCTCCNQLSQSTYIGWLQKYEKICKKSVQATNLTLLFEDVSAPQKIEYLKKNKLLLAPIEQALNARDNCICFQIIHIIYMYKLCLALNDP